jgi:hypothetical protein
MAKSVMLVKMQRKLLPGVEDDFAKFSSIQVYMMSDL